MTGSWDLVSVSISTYLVPRLHKSAPTRHYKCHHSTRIVKTHIKKMSLEFPFEASSAVGRAYWLLETVPRLRTSDWEGPISHGSSDELMSVGGFIAHQCLHGMAPNYLSTMCHPASRLPGRQNLRSTRYIVVVRCSSLRACWSISVEHSARSSQEPQFVSYNFHAPS